MASASARHTLLLLAAATTTMVAVAVSVGATASSELMMSSTIHARVAAEWASSSTSSSDDSCWGSPEECPVVYDVDANGGGAAATPRGRMGLQLYYDDVNTAASLLPTAEFITYSALMPDSVPCSVPGASYYNCQPGAEANPYTRGCSAITQCRD